MSAWLLFVLFLALALYLWLGVGAWCIGRAARDDEDDTWYKPGDNGSSHREWMRRKRAKEKA